MKPATALLLDVLLFLSIAAAIVALGGLLYGTLGEGLRWPDPLPRIADSKTHLGLPKNTETGSQAAGTYDATGLAMGEGYEIVRATCTACHSAKLVTQNRATRAGWEEMIRWMQAKQGLWDLGENEAAILDYLATHYGVEEQDGRRANLEDISWYILDLAEIK